jgi:glycosyltransferase involved in cell wall biosynthesis
MTVSLSVVLPVRNGMPFLPAAIGSILGQTHTNFELIVVDDGSTDQSSDFLRSLHDPRVRVLHAPARGLAAALNAGLESARGQYVARHDADDRSAPGRFARQVALLDTRPEIAVVATCANYINEHDRAVDDEWTRIVRAQQDPAQTPEAILRLMPLTCCVTHGSVMARTGVLRRAGGYDPDTVPAEDYDLWLRLLPAHQFVKVSERLYDYRVHTAQSGAVRREEQTARVIEAKLRFLRREVPGLPARARLELPCNDRGAELFRKYGPNEGFVSGSEPGGNGTRHLAAADVIAVTDFSLVAHYATRLTPLGYQQVGNLFARPPARTLERGA